MTKVRFAPSPTGRLHLGNARTALVNWLFARQSCGRFLLRLDDTDRERSRLGIEFADAIETDLRWLGLDWDEYRAAVHAARPRLYRGGRAPEGRGPALSLFRERGGARPQAQARAAAGTAAGSTTAAALALSREEIARRIAAGEAPHWRFKLEHRATAWDDLVRGPTEFQGAHLSDPVLVRADGMPLYTFSSVVDDADLDITHVIRGEDHVTNTAFQSQIFEALGHQPPAFAHLSLITGKGGEALLQAHGQPEPRRALREDGIEPMAINSLLAKLGTSDAIEPRVDLAALVAGSISRNSAARSRISIPPRTRRQLQREAAASDAVRDRRGKVAQGRYARLLGGGALNLERVSDAAYWWRESARARVAPTIAPGDETFLAKPRRVAARRSPSMSRPGRAGPIAWRRRRGARAGRSFIRSAWRSPRRSRDPRLRNLLPLIGRERALHRLQGERA